MRVADYLTDALYRAGGEKVFMITGGMIMHLTDALYQHGAQQWICCHHEQAAVMAAEGYGRYSNRLGVAYVTAGPGALNTLTGVVGAYVDNAPLVVVSGQSKLSQATVTSCRQFALQGFNTMPLFSQVTKYAVMLSDVTTVRYEVEKAVHLATTGRKGPVWIECPIDIQAMAFDPEAYEGFTPPDGPVYADDAAQAAGQVLEALEGAERPCFLFGAGVRAADATKAMDEAVRTLGVPALTSRLGMDLMAFEDPHYVGRPGTYGDRPANFAVQNCDLLVVVGCRLGIGLVGYDFENFAKNARVIMVDIDPDEMDKPSVVPDVKLHVDAGDFLTQLAAAAKGREHRSAWWLARTQDWKRRYPVDLPEYTKTPQYVNSYHFTRVLSEHLEEGSVVTLDTGSCFHVHAQAFKVKQGQRHIITGGLSTMGYCPAATGVAAAHGGPVYCVTGDGSFQFNIQELQTVRHYNLPIKFVLFNNNGYLLIRLTQNNFQGGRHIGTHAETGVSFPDLKALTAAYGIDYMRIDANAGLEAGIKALVAHPGPVLCEVMTPPDQVLQPRVASKQLKDGTMVSMPYDHMFPFLPEEEYLANTTFGDVAEG